MKKVVLSVVTILITMLLVVGGYFGYRMISRYLPGKEPADIETWFGVTGEDVAIVLNNELSEVTGIYREDSVYLPVDWVTDMLNEKFYWDTSTEELVYTLPESIVYADQDTLGNEGKHLLIQKKDQIYVLSSLVQTYTDIRMQSFADADAKRIFIDQSWEPHQTAAIKKKEAVREKGGIKSGILTQVEQGVSVTILDIMETWTKVRTEDGFIGYVRSKRLSQAQEIVPESTFVTPEYTSISMEKPIVLVWHQVLSTEANSGLDSMIANTSGVNVVAPTWFMLTDNEGSFQSFADQLYVDKVHQMGAQVWAVLDNFNMGDNVKSEVLFASMDARKKIISGLVAEVQKYQIDGINLDIEGIKPAAGPHYVQFIRELSVSCRTNGIILSVDSYVPSDYTYFYNRAEQGRVADYVVIMGYDEHYAGGEMGTVASLDYEETGIQKTIDQVPKEKVISAIPFYTRLWKVEDGKTTSTAMSLENAADWAKKNEVNLTWDDTLGQYYGELKKGNTSYYIWMEDETSLKLKAALVEQYDLAGIACWKLGFDTSNIWKVIAPQ